MPFAASADLSALAADLAAAGQGIEKAAELVVASTAQKVQALAIAKAPRLTGKLAASITIRWEGKTTAIIGPQVKYGEYQEFGTASRGEFGGQPYVIRPKTAGGVLAFKINGRTIITKQVTHPGVKAQPFMRPALQEALGPMAERLAQTGALLITRGPKAVLP